MFVRDPVDRARARVLPAQSMTPPSSSVAERRATFRRLHTSGCFVIPNPWDAGTARYLTELKFAALATTSAGMAFAAGLPDAKGAVPRDRMLAHIAEVVAATPLPVNADFEAGYAADAEGVAQSVRLCVESGVAGLSIEDATGDPQQPLFDLSDAVERMKAARRAVDESHSGVVLTGRSECFLVGHPGAMAESIRRLTAYAEAGADVLYAPGVQTREQIETLVRALAPKPVNVLVSSNTGLTVTDLAELGVRRVSVGSGLARVAWGAFMRASREIAERGAFTAFADAATFRELNTLFEAGR